MGILASKKQGTITVYRRFSAADMVTVVEMLPMSLEHRAEQRQKLPYKGDADTKELFLRRDLESIANLKLAMELAVARLDIAATSLNRRHGSPE